MDFIEKLHQLATKIPALCDHLETEEATKNALVMPFIAALGYDVFNPLEVIPEFTADYGTKRGEKVDYAIKKMAESLCFLNANIAAAIYQSIMPDNYIVILVLPMLESEF